MRLNPAVRAPFGPGCRVELELSIVIKFVELLTKYGQEAEDLLRGAIYLHTL